MSIRLCWMVLGMCLYGTCWRCTRERREGRLSCLQDLEVMRNADIEYSSRTGSSLDGRYLVCPPAAKKRPGKRRARSIAVVVDQRGKRPSVSTGDWEGRYAEMRESQEDKKLAGLGLRI